MLSTTVFHTSRHCGSERIRKNGHTAGGAQKGQVSGLPAYLGLGPKEPALRPSFQRPGARRLPEPPEHLRHRTNFRGVLPNRGGLAGEKTESLPAFVDTLLSAENGDVLELDELWSFVGAIHVLITTYNLAVQQQATRSR